MLFDGGVVFTLVSQPLSESLEMLVQLDIAHVYFGFLLGLMTTAQLLLARCLGFIGFALCCISLCFLSFLFTFPLLFFLLLSLPFFFCLACFLGLSLGLLPLFVLRFALRFQSGSFLLLSTQPLSGLTLEPFLFLAGLLLFANPALFLGYQMLPQGLLGLLADSVVVSGDYVKGGIVLGFALAIDLVEVFVKISALVDLGLLDICREDPALLELPCQVQGKLPRWAVQVCVGSSAHFGEVRGDLSEGNWSVGGGVVGNRAW